MYKRIDLGTARKLYNTETNIYMLPSKMKVDNIWFSPVLITPRRKKAILLTKFIMSSFTITATQKWEKESTFI